MRVLADLMMVSTVTTKGVDESLHLHRKVWFFNAPVDLLVCCGGLLWMIVGVHSFVSFPYHRAPLLFSPESSPGEQALFFLLYAGAFLVSYPHNLATFVRVYGTKASFQKYKLCAVVTPLLTVLLLIGAVIQPELIAWYVRVTVIWNIQHWVAQSYGLGMLYCSRANFNLSKIEKKLWWIACQLLILWAGVKILAFPESQAMRYFGIPVLPIAFASEEVFQFTELICLGSWAIIAAVLARGWVKAKQMPPLAVIVLYITIFRITTMSFAANLDIWLFALPLFHGLQYLVLTTKYYAKEHGVIHSPGTSFWKSIVSSKVMRRYYGGLVAAGGAVYLGGPQLLRLFGLPVENATALVFLLFNFQHILIDAFIWRLKDPAVRENL